MINCDTKSVLTFNDNAVTVLSIGGLKNDCDRTTH